MDFIADLHSAAKSLQSETTETAVEAPSAASKALAEKVAFVRHMKAQAKEEYLDHLSQLRAGIGATQREYDTVHRHYRNTINHLNSL